MLIRRFNDKDSVQISDIICRNFLEVNIKDYPKEEMLQLTELHTPEKVLSIAGNAHMYVACNDTGIIGCGAIEFCPSNPGECFLKTIFVKPEYQGQGIGKVIIQTLEKDDIFLQAKRIELHASITACEFYKKLGYDYVNGEKCLDGNNLYPMEKKRMPV